MIEIPKQLQKDEFRFVLLKKESKKPFEEEWTTKNNYKYNDTKLLNHIKENGNYGVMCGYGDLVILDIDNLNMLKELEEILSETFTVETGSGKQHLYFIGPKDTEKIILDKDNIHYGELQSKGAQCVGVGSIHPTTKREYKVIKDIDIHTITTTKIELLKLKYTNGKKTIVVESPQWDKYKTLSISNDLSILSLINTTGMKKHGNEYYGTHPLHGSETGMNFFVNPVKNMWHCFRHNCGGDSLSYLAMKEGIISCGEKLRGKNFMKTLEIGQTKYNLKLPQEDVNKMFSKPIFSDENFDPYEMKELRDELEVVYGHQLENLKIREVEWLIENLIPKGSLTLIGGKSASYKSTATLHSVYAISEGLEVFNKLKTIKAKILYLNEENAWNVFKPLAEKIQHGLKIITPANICFVTFQDVRLDTQRGLEMLKNVIEKHRPEVLVLDSLKRFIGFEENNADKVNEFYINVLKPLMIKYKLTIILIHHAKKDVQGIHKLDMLRGSSDFVNIVDSILFFKRLPGKPWFEMEQLKNRAKVEMNKRKIVINDTNLGFEFKDVTEKTDNETEIDVTDCSNEIIEYFKKHKDMKEFTVKELLNVIEDYGQARIYEATNELLKTDVIIKVKIGVYRINRQHEIFAEKNLKEEKKDLDINSFVS